MTTTANLPPAMSREEWAKILEFDRKVYRETGHHFVDIEGIKFAARRGGFDLSGKLVADLEDQLETNERRAKKERREERAKVEEIKYDDGKETDSVPPELPVNAQEVDLNPSQDAGLPSASTQND